MHDSVNELGFCFLIFSTMSLKSRKFSLDSSVSLDGAGILGVRRGSSRFSSKKSRNSQSLDEARLEIQELNHSLNHNMSVREQTIAEESLERTQELITHNGILKQSKTFHKLFPEIPEGKNPAHTFICALQKEVLYHGKLYISENHVCFHSSVLLKDTKVAIPASSVSEVKKHNSALSMLSIQTADGEKYSFVSLRNRDKCYKLLQHICSQAQVESPHSSPHLSSAEDEADHNVVSSSSLEDSVDQDMSRQNSISFDNGFPPLSSEGPTRCNSIRQNSSTDEDDRAVSWTQRVIEKFTFLRATRNLSVFFHIYMMLIVLLLLASGYIGLRITALEEQLNSLGALTELSLYHSQHKET